MDAQCSLDKKYVQRAPQEFSAAQMIPHHVLIILSQYFDNMDLFCYQKHLHILWEAMNQFLVSTHLMWERSWLMSTVFMVLM